MKTQVKKPMVALSEAKFSSTALIGKSTEPVNRNSRSSVVTTIQSAAIGRLRSMPCCESV